jgi:hypothetical protein
VTASRRLGLVSALVVIGALGAGAGCSSGSGGGPPLDLSGLFGDQPGGGYDLPAGSDVPSGNVDGGGPGSDGAIPGRDGAGPGGDAGGPGSDAPGPGEDVPVGGPDVPPGDDAVSPPPDSMTSTSPDAGTDPCAGQCTGRTCGTGTCGGSCGTCPSDQTCSALRECQCATPAEFVFYTSRAWNILADALQADPSPCAHHYISIPAATDTDGLKTQPRAGEAAAMHARGPRFHALAEFHFASWSQRTDLTWYQRGVEFRRRMVDRGYDVNANDGWAINEFPSTVRSSATTRQNIRDLVRGLHDGPAGSPASRGTVFIVGLGHGTTNLGPYKSNLETWLEDAPFWVDMNGYVRFFSQEVYIDPFLTCVPNTSVGVRAQHINAFSEHLAELATVGPTSVNTAQSYLGRSYLPLLNAVWNSPASRGYGNTVIPLAQMKQHVSGQVYATRAWEGAHTFPDGRIGFGWDQAPGVTATDLADLAQRLASSLHHAYDAGGGSAAGACSPSGAFTFCQCSLSSAAFNEAWSTVSTF